jgi:hypothetical protein
MVFQEEDHGCEEKEYLKGVYLFGRVDLKKVCN